MSDINGKNELEKTLENGHYEIIKKQGTVTREFYYVAKIWYNKQWTKIHRFGGLTPIEAPDTSLYSSVADATTAAQFAFQEQVKRDKPLAEPKVVKKGKFRQE